MPRLIGTDKFPDAGLNRLGLEAVGVVDAVSSALMGQGIEKVVTLDFARFIDQDAQGFADAVQSEAQQSRKSGDPFAGSA